jgi:hypothetical protein
MAGAAPAATMQRTLRKEDKLRSVLEAEGRSIDARTKADEAGDVAAQARALATKILNDTAAFLGVK